MRGNTWNSRVHTWSDHNERRYSRYCPRARLLRTLRTIRLETRNYFDNTTLHGFKYVTAPDGSLIEKFIWLMICMLGIVFSVILMFLVWQRFLKTPTVTTIATTTHPIWGLPFPAVTICNFNKVYRPHADQLTDEFKKHGLNSTEIGNFFTSLPKLIRPEEISVDLSRVTKVLAKLGYSVNYVMQRLMQPCDKLLRRCTWLGKPYPCTKIFKTIKSIEGFCCSFNYHAVDSGLQVKDLLQPWDRENGDKLDVVPVLVATTTTSTTLASEWLPGVEEVQMVAGAGRDIGLSVIFDVESENYSGATRPNFGASVLIHDPEDYPETSMQSSKAEEGEEVSIAISGSIIESVDNVRSLSLEQRQCWFDDEVKLQSSVAYSYQTCVTECRINHIANLCDCIPFYYPDIFMDTLRTCELSDVKCLLTYRRILSSLQTPITTLEENTTKQHAQCSCLPQCSDKWYALDSETTNLRNIKYDSPMLFGLNLTNLSLIHVYFRDISCMKYRRDTLMTWDGLFASFGGIFGLCLGGSVVSLVELIYYFTAKIFHSKKYQNKPPATTLTNTEIGKRGKLKKPEGTTNGRLDNLNVFKDKIYFHDNNFIWDEVRVLPKHNKSFTAASGSRG